MREWDEGRLCTPEDCQAAANVIRDYLERGRYTFVSSIPAIGHLEVRTDQTVKEVSVHHHSDTHVQVIVSDSYGVWDFSWIGDGSEDTPRVWWRGQANIVIKHQSRGGNEITWVLAAQRAE